ncbi:MAG: helix-turn-helix domain-containing protein [Myxococcota bacterium]
MGPGERWVGVDDVAAHLGVGKDSIYRWVESRGLPARKVGRLLRFKLSEVDAWVEAGSGEGHGPAEPRTPSRNARRKKGGGG